MTDAPTAAEELAMIIAHRLFLNDHGRKMHTPLGFWTGNKFLSAAEKLQATEAAQALLAAGYCKRADVWEGAESMQATVDLLASVSFTMTPGPYRFNGGSIVAGDGVYLCELSSPRGFEQRDADGKAIAAILNDFAGHASQPGEPASNEGGDGSEPDRSS